MESAEVAGYDEHIMRTLLLGSMVLMLTGGALAQDAPAELPPPFPRPNATLLSETDRLRVWDIVWPKGEPSPLHRHIYDQVGTYYSPGDRVITAPGGNPRAASTPVGAISTTRKGATHVEEGSSVPPLRAVFIELKQPSSSGTPPAAGVPAAFPRDGARQVHDEERVAAWDYTWSGGPQGLRFRAARETVIVWLGNGQVRVKGDGATGTTLDVKPGATRRIEGGSGETLEMVSGAPRTIFFEFK